MEFTVAQLATHFKHFLQPTLSRWYSGSTPSLEWQEKLALFFEIDREALFRHPDDDWIAKFFRGRSEEERERMKKMLEAAFPLKTGTGG
jgi:hypothetical protein